MNNVVDLAEYRKKREEYKRKKRVFIDEFMAYLEYTMEFESDIELEDWFDNLETITYTISVDENETKNNDDEETEDPS